ncbi:MAG: aldo/keto reductase [Candidatus Riflebacteria bacterium]|nr:aldo/keto reductase [Candidatus Riflebacteria bacterium]
MQYRKFGKMDWQPSALGFGCMRLPTKSKGFWTSDVIEDEAIQMIRYAIDHGVNYFDTGYPYHGGFSEKILGKALKDGYREKIKIATKSPTFFLKKESDFCTFLDEQLQRLQTDFIDFYLLHGLDRSRWEKVVKEFEILSKAEEAKKAGKIGHIGFSFHDREDAFPIIIDGYDKWEFCQIQYNYLDTETQAGTKGLKYAASKGIPVIIMEPLLGGKLANVPQTIQDIFDSSGLKRPAFDWGLQWVWNHPEVGFLLSGMSSMEQLKANLQSVEKSGINSMSEKEMAAIASVQEAFKKMNVIPCTKCGYCLPCPHGVNIPKNFEMYNDSHAFNDLNGSKKAYKGIGGFFGPQSLASGCVQCKACEEKCPQHIPIAEWMPKVHSRLKEES